jgi:microcin C transport system substrate-binding protein
MVFTRRGLIKVLGSLSLLPGFRVVAASVAHADEPAWRHGLSLFGDVKYPADFPHFDYVNPDAPRGGRVRLFTVGTFDSLNPFSFKGNPAFLVASTVDSLVKSASDEPSSEYGLIAEAMKYPEDYSSVTYRLRPEARFHDGEPITPDDVIWSMTHLKLVNPQSAFYYKNIARAEQTSEREVTFVFSVKGNRELPQITGQLQVLPRHWWEGSDDRGRQRDLNETTLEIPIGSGAYQISEVKTGVSITARRLDDYWGARLAVNIGQNNFDELTVVYFRDTTVALEAFKSDQYDYRAENSSKNWATAYDFPAVTRGDVVREEITLKNVQGMQSFAFNTRRKKFADKRLRLAFNHAFDFEWSNANLFYGQYKRSASYFSNSELAATGLPGPDELALLEPLRGKIPDEVFTTEYTNPVNATPQDRRANLRTALDLLGAAGWTIGPDRKLVNAAGEALEVEFLLVSPLFERIVLPYAEQLKLIGIQSLVRTVDDAQYERRRQNFDYDIIVASWGQSLSPGNEQRNYWGSEAADRPGSFNFVGIRDAAIDRLIDAVIFATSRAGLIAATRALDRVLLWNQFVVPMWHIPYERIARWDRFARPDKLPDYSVGFPDIWWWDEARAARIKAGQ